MARVISHVDHVGVIAATSQEAELPGIDVKRNQSYRSTKPKFMIILGHKFLNRLVFELPGSKMATGEPRPVIKAEHIVVEIITAEFKDVGRYPYPIVPVYHDVPDYKVWYSSYYCVGAGHHAGPVIGGRVVHIQTRHGRYPNSPLAVFGNGIDDFIGDGIAGCGSEYFKGMSIVPV